MMIGYRALALLSTAGALALPLLSSQQPDLGRQAAAILKKHCDKCHGSAPGAAMVSLFDIRDHKTMLGKRQIVPGKPAESRIYIRSVLGTGGAMPPPESKDPLTDDEKKLLKAWIEAGAPEPRGNGSPKPAARRAISNEEVVQAIARDVDTAGERDRPYLRYFTLTTLYNAGADSARIAEFRVGLSKLINSLSWQRRIAVPQPIDPAQTILRIDMRKYSWTDETWKKLLHAYPYGFAPSTPEMDRVRTATGCELPFVRGDWFVARAGSPPLYHDLLDLPRMAKELETRLIVDVAKNIREETAVRAGFSESGVSRHNRVVERHESAYGGYWRSYDFSASSGVQNIFKHPLDFREAGGEIIFSLPNGLQGYMLVNATGERIDAGPAEIVSNSDNPRDPVIRNGLTCMSCHAQGMRRFSDRADQARSTIAAAHQPDFDKEKALALYGTREKVDGLVEEDANRFAAAVRATGADVGDREPIVALAASYDVALSRGQAAIELGVTEAALDKRIAGSGRAAELLGVLKSAGSTLKRDAWEEYFVEVASDISQSAAAAGAPSGGPGALELYICDHASATIKLYDGQSGRFIRDFAKGNGLNVASQMAFGPDRNLYVSIGDNAVQRFDGKTGEFLGTFASGHGLNNCTAMELGRDGNLYVASAWENQIMRFDAKTGEFRGEALSGDRGGLDVIIHFALAPDGSIYVISGNHIRQGGQDKVKHYDGKTGAFLGDVGGRVNLGRPGRLFFAPDGSLCVAGNAGMKRFDVKTGALLGDLIDKPTALTGGAFAFGPDGNFYMCVGPPIGVKRFDGKSGQPMGELVKPGAGSLGSADIMIFNASAQPSSLPSGAQSAETSSKPTPKTQPAAPQPAKALRYGYVRLDRDVDAATVGADLNNKGQVLLREQGGQDRSFVWQENKRTILPNQGHPRVDAFAINDSGAVVGFLRDDAAPPRAWQRPFLWSDGKLALLSPPADPDADVRLINSRGQIAGMIPGAQGGSQVFLLENGKTRLLFAGGVPNAMNSAGQIVGQMLATPDPSYPFFWDGARLVELRDSKHGSFVSINDKGLAVGSKSIGRPDGSSRDIPILYQDGKVSELRLLPKMSIGHPASINASGQIVGVCRKDLNKGFTDSRGFLWENGRLTDVNDLVSLPKGWTVTECIRINDRGQILATAWTGKEDHLLLLTPK